MFPAIECCRLWLLPALVSKPRGDGADDAVGGREAGASRGRRCIAAKHVPMCENIFKADIEPSGPHRIAAKFRERAPDQVDDRLLHGAVQ